MHVHSSILLFGKASTDKKLPGIDPRRVLTKDSAHSAITFINTERSFPSILVVVHIPCALSPQWMDLLTRCYLHTILPLQSLLVRQQAKVRILLICKNYFHKILRKANL